jgi:outer membrane protein TolC
MSSEVITVLPQALPQPEAPPRPLPISLDTVLRLAQDQNGQIGLAREKVNEAFAEKAVADKRWLPDVYLGTSYYRHEGGIADFTGQLIHSSFGTLFGGLEITSHLDLRDLVYQKVDAERKVWQQKGELARVNNEQLLDAANTYVDMLTARTGEAVSLELERMLRDLLKQTTDLNETVKGLEAEIERINTEISAQQQISRKLRQGATSAAAKLAYLLGLDPNMEMVPVDPRLAPFTLVDPSLPPDELVNRALAAGPGVHELEGLLALVQQSAERSRGLVQWLPSLEVNLGEGIFGTGPGSSSDWDNRFDVCVHARWNLTQFATRCEQQRVLQSKINQVHLAYKDLRAKLTAGVQEAREASLSYHDQMQHGERQIEHARKAHEQSKYRLTNIKGAAPSEVLLAIRSLGGGQLGYLSAMRDYDKAQLRLLLLTGAVGGPETGHGGCGH